MVRSPRFPPSPFCSERGGWVQRCQGQPTNSPVRNNETATLGREALYPYEIPRPTALDSTLILLGIVKLGILYICLQLSTRSQGRKDQYLAFCTGETVDWMFFMGLDPGCADPVGAFPKFWLPSLWELGMALLSGWASRSWVLPLLGGPPGESDVPRSPTC
jgi:hypothetical protein